MASVDDGPRPRRRRTALTRWEWSYWGRLNLIQYWGTDPEFVDDLNRLWEEHSATIQRLAHGRHSLQRVGDTYDPGWIDWLADRIVIDPEEGIPPDVQSYAHAVFELAAYWGLDRIPDGRRAIHEWCLWHVVDARLDASRIGVGWSFGGMLPDVGEDVWGQREVYDERTGERRTITFSNRLPIVRIALDATWDARDEPRTAARERIMRQLSGLVDAELARLQSEYEASGYVFPDTRPNLQRDMQWLYRRIGHRELIAAIAESDNVPESTVRSAITKLAQELGVALGNL